MCLIFVCYNQHPVYPLIVAANRDEYYARPCTGIQQWENNTAIVAGKDLVKGGTWMGLSRYGRFAAVTNVRSGQATEDRKSRGELVLSLLSRECARSFVDGELAFSYGDYNDFNCLYYFQQQLYYFNNRTSTYKAVLQPGVYGLSNGLLDTPWPKLTEGKAEFCQAISAVPDDSALWAVMSDRRQAPEEQLPNTGVSREWEQLLSSRFIHSNDYGTRSTTLVMWSRNGTVTMKERRYNAKGFIDQNEITLKLDHADERLH